MAGGRDSWMSSSLILVPKARIALGGKRADINADSKGRRIKCP